MTHSKINLSISEPPISTESADPLSGVGCVLWPFLGHKIKIRARSVRVNPCLIL